MWLFKIKNQAKKLTLVPYGKGEILRFLRKFGLQKEEKTDFWKIFRGFQIFNDVWPFFCWNLNSAPPKNCCQTIFFVFLNSFFERKKNPFENYLKKSFKMVKKPEKIL